MGISSRGVPLKPSVSGGGGLVGTSIYPTAAALQAAFPAAANSGKSGLVGTVAPYTLHVSDGASWAAVRSEQGYATPPNKIYAYEEDGSILARCMPRKSRITQSGAKLWTPTALTDTAARTALVYSGAAFLAAETTTAPPVEITSLTGAYMDCDWTGLNLPAQTSGLVQALVWVDDFQAGAASPLGGSVQLSLYTASGGLTITYSSPAFKPGWNTLQFWDPADADVHVAMNKTGVSVAGTKTLNFAENIIRVRITCNTPAAGSKLRFAGLFSQTKIKPMVCMTFDAASTNGDVFSNFVPAWYAKGFSAGIRAGGSTDGTFRATILANLQSAYDLGFDVYNGSWSRVNLNTSTTSAVFAAEVGLQKNWQSRHGLHRGSGLFSSAGNGLPKASIYRDILPKFGLRSAKTGGGQGYVNIVGPAGFDDRYAITAAGWGGRTKAIQQINAAIKMGGIVMWFGHECPAYGSEPPPDSGSPSNGGGMYAEDAIYFANYLRGLQDAGTLDVVSPSQLEDILDGYR